MSDFRHSLTPAIKQLMLVNVGVFVLNAVLVGRLSDMAAGGGGHWFAFSIGTVLDGFGLGALRVVTYQFTHSFHDPWHLLLNMLVLWFFGPMAEARLGQVGTWKLYLWGGFIGALGHVLIAALQGYASMPLVGASGACYSFLVYAACMAPHSTVLLMLVFPIPLWTLAALLVGLGVYLTFVEFATGSVGGVSHGAHLGGAALGYLVYRMGWFIDYGGYAPRPGGGLRRFWAKLQERRRTRAAADDARQQGRMDEILAKVKTSGLSSLSADERRFLDRMSQRARDRD
jgi:membrane associated rhomboid family serine protease